jgi:hypothetical protein
VVPDILSSHSQRSVNAVLIFTSQVHVPVLRVQFFSCLLTEILGHGSKYVTY